MGIVGCCQDVVGSVGWIVDVCLQPDLKLAIFVSVEDQTDSQRQISSQGRETERITPAGKTLHKKPFG